VKKILNKISVVTAVVTISAFFGKFYTDFHGIRIGHGLLLKIGDYDLNVLLKRCKI